MEDSCIVANEALLYLINSIPKDVEGIQKEMRESFCEAQDWLHTLYGQLQAEREKTMAILKQNEIVIKAPEKPDQIELVAND